MRRLRWRGPSPAICPSAHRMWAAGRTSPPASGYTGPPRTFRWNPSFNGIADTSKFKKDGSYTIGFSNASQADLWLVTFFHGVEWAAGKQAAKLKRFIVTDANSDSTKQ